MNDKEKKELIAKILNLYAFAQAFSSLNLNDCSDIKLNSQGLNPDLVDIQYRLVHRSSLELSHQHSAKMFKVLYDDIRKAYS